MKDPALRSVSLAGRGLWMDILCLMFEASPRGYLVLNGKPVSVEQLARMVGSTADEVSRLMDEVISSGVASMTDQECLYSRRMVRDEEIRGIRRKCGSLGGNPVLVNQTRISLTKYQPNTQPKPKQIPKQNSPPSSSSSFSKNKKEKLLKRKSPFPDSFEVTAEMQAWATTLGVVEVNQQTDNFRDHHTAKGSLFLDWRAAWRTWMRNHVIWHGGSPGGRKNTDIDAEISAMISERVAENERKRNEPE